MLLHELVVYITLVSLQGPKHARQEFVTGVVCGGRQSTMTSCSFAKRIVAGL